MPPVDTVGMTTDEDMNQLIASVRDSIGRELYSHRWTRISYTDL